MYFKTHVREELKRIVSNAADLKEAVDAWAGALLSNGKIDFVQYNIIINGIGTTSTSEGMRELVKTLSYDGDI